MRQGNGSDLLGLKDPRSTKIGIIYVASNDDRKSVLAAILTQEKLGRKQIAIVLPENQPNKAFQHSQDFDDLKTVQRKLRAQLIFITPAGPGPAELARQRRFSVYSSLESYTEALHAESLFAGTRTKEKKGRLFGFGRKTVPLAGAAAIALSGKKGQSVPVASPSSDNRTENAPNHTPSSSADLPNPNQEQPHKDDESVLSETEAEQVPSIPVTDTNDEVTPSIAAVASSTAAGIVAADLINERVQQFVTPNVPDASMDDDWDALPPAPSTPSPQKNVPVASSALNATPPPPPPPLSSMPNTPDPAGGAGPDIIELSSSPLAASRRSTRKLPAVDENAAVTSIAPSSVTPLPRASLKSRNAERIAAVTGAATTVLPSRGISVSHPLVRGGKATQTEARRRKRGLGGFVVAVLVAALLLLCSGVASSMAGFQLFPFVGNSAPATVTITPDSKVEQDNYIIQAVTGNADPAKRQIPLRQLTFSPPNQSKSVTATGVGHIPAQPAAGQLTFYNGSTQDYWIGSTTAIPGPNGVSVVPDAPVRVPAGNPPSAFGSASVSAHATTAGSNGNLAAGAIHESCCAAGGSITVNSSAFTGGQDEQDYTFLQQSDVDGYADQLKPTLSQQALNGLKGQLKSNEQLAGDPQCTTQSSEDQAVGDQGHNVASANVTVSATCTGVAYDASRAQTLAQNLLKKKAISNLGQAYALAGTILTKSTVTDVEDGVVTLQVAVSGTWSYQFDDKQKQTLANQLANKTHTAAQGFLNTSKGVGKAKIDIANGDDSLPGDPGRISILILAVSAGVSPTNQPAARPTGPSSTNKGRG